MKVLISILLFSLLVSKRSEFKINHEQGTIQIQGTSSVHDWVSEVTRFTISGKFEEESVTDLKVTIPIASIESGKSIMNDKTYEALECKSFPNIIYEADRLSLKDKTLAGKGQLTMANVTRDITITSEITDHSTTYLKLKGIVALKMTDFGIKPPTAMFGSLKTGDEITIVFNMTVPK